MNAEPPASFAHWVEPRIEVRAGQWRFSRVDALDRPLGSEIIHEWDGRTFLIDDGTGLLAPA